RAARRQLKRVERTVGHDDPELLAGVQKARDKAEQALVDGRAKATADAEAAGASRSRATGVLDRAENGRGRAGYWARAVTRLGLDVPVTARTRRLLGTVAGLGIGASAGLWVGGHVAVLAVAGGPVAGLVLVAAGLVAAARAMWSPRQTRGPPLQALKRAVRSG